MPTLIGLMMAVGILRASGFLEFFGGLIGKITEPMGLPAPIVPLIFIKLFSSSAATGLVLDIFKNYGTDSYIGMMTSILMSCTETCFYTMSEMCIRDRPEHDPLFCAWHCDQSYSYYASGLYAVQKGVPAAEAADGTVCLYHVFFGWAYPKLPADAETPYYCLLYTSRCV